MRCESERFCAGPKRLSERSASISMPAQKTEPAPVRIRLRAPVLLCSSQHSSRARKISSIISNDMALRRSGRLSVSKEEWGLWTRTRVCMNHPTPELKPRFYSGGARRTDAEWRREDGRSGGQGRRRGGGEGGGSAIFAAELLNPIESAGPIARDGRSLGTDSRQGGQRHLGRNIAD